MNKLIWFSIPGAIIILPLILMVPNIGKDWIIGLIGIPILGFIIHQLWRTIFELLGGFKSEKREIIKAIKNWNKNIKENEAFLVWEMTFYSEVVDKSFREHDRGAWHYIMSFYTCSIASGLSILIMIASNIINYLIYNNCFTNIKPLDLPCSCCLIVIFFILGFLFFAKAKLTSESIDRQELALLKIFEEDFKNTARKLGII
jgi:hypothetical protein